MPEFVNPFSGVVPGRKLTARELTRAMRLTLSAEEEAVHLYEALADATDHPLAKAVLQDIANEERVHAGEFQQVLNLLLTDEQKWMADGAGEVMAMAVKVGGAPAGSAGGESAAAAAAESKPIPTVGDLKT